MVLQESYDALQRQSEKQQDKLQELEEQVATMVSIESYETLQKHSEEQKAELESFQSQADLMVSKENYEALQHQLQEQLNKLKNMESIVAAMIPQETYQALEKESELQKEIIADYQNKLTQLQQKYHNQSEKIEASQKQISELQTPAMIAQHHILNKWQYRTFSR
ncbi:hypothetical protein AFK68_00245 [Hydrocoleum sp. CS-953]|nr:hypothetical protein AFK68_00245 [Hydrocoleum sp. CS-953]